MLSFDAAGGGNAFVLCVFYCFSTYMTPAVASKRGRDVSVCVQPKKESVLVQDKMELFR